ncbi:hypothetical protein [Nioella aestuarii]|uniref:hypothetical protein n=1 Tax=Nioella aestuarii TaxID=1662864 RepID=UPI003D7FFB24
MRVLPLSLLLLASPALSDPARILGAEATRAQSDWRFDVTLEHDDTGWDDYADGWRIELSDGTVLGTRILAHPHVTEQPFTRSLSGVAVPEGTRSVHIRARTNQTGWDNETVALTLP